VQGIDIDLSDVNPSVKWQRLVSEHSQHLDDRTFDLAEQRYLAAKTDTDLEGHGNLVGLPPGEYWISTLSLEAAAGDIRLRWDVPFTVEAGQTARVELTNLNAADARGGTP